MPIAASAVIEPRLAFSIGVENVQPDPELFGLPAQQVVELAGRGRSIQLGLAATQILHVRALDEQQLHGSSINNFTSN